MNEVDVVFAEQGSPGTVLLTSPTYVGNCPGVLVQPDPLADKHVPIVSLSFICDIVEVTIRTNTGSVALIRQIAEDFQ